MANETELSNFVTIGNAVSTLMSPAFKEASIMLNLCHTENFPDNTNVIKFRKSGSLTAEALAESTAYSYSASSELTDTSVSATAAKVVAASKVTVEALRFGTGSANMERIAQEQGRAIARMYDDDVIALFDNFATTQTATSVLTVDDMITAQYKVYNGNVPVGKLAAVLEYKGAHEIRKEIQSTGGTPWSNMSMLEILNGTPQPNGYVGSVAGMDVYQTTGMPTGGGDDYALVFNPQWTFAAGLGGAFSTNVWYDPVSFLYVVSSFMFYNVVEWNDTAGCSLLSDT